MARGFIILQDVSSPTGSRLFNGSEIRAYVANVTIGASQNVDTAFKPNQEFELDSTDGGDIGSNWNRRKAHVQAIGTENLQISLAGGWDTKQTGSILEETEILSPYKLMRMALSGHTFYIKGGTAVQYLIDSTDSESFGNYYTGSGIPVKVANWSIEDAAVNLEYVSWQLALIEDKDTVFLTN